MWKLKRSTYNMLPILVASCYQSNHANQDTTIIHVRPNQSGYYFLCKFKWDFLFIKVQDTQLQKVGLDR